MSKKNFEVIVPAKLQKGEDGDYKIWGLASTAAFDQQGETVLPSGIDVTAIEKGSGYFNFEHSSDPENLLGVLEGYEKNTDHLYVHGSLFKGHPRAEAVYAIMKALEEKGKTAVGLSIEGEVIERDEDDNSIIKQCRVNNVSLTFKPANPETYASLMKSIKDTDIEFQSKKENPEELQKEETMFSATQVMDLLYKSLAMGQNYGATAPGNLSGGSALSQESMGTKEEKKEKAPKEEETEKAETNTLESLMKELQILYPDVSEETLWIAFKNRLREKVKASML